MTKRITQVAFASRLGVIFFTLGKLIRFLLFLFFLLLIMQNTKADAGFTTWQIILFFITFNIVDVLSQFLLREVYRFREYVVSGNFDHILLKPISPLFRSLFGGSDILDFVTLIPLVGFLVFTVTKLDPVSILQIIFYVLLLCNSLIIAISLHIFVLALGVITTEVDNAVWLIRDITQLGRVPVDIYKSTMRTLLTFVLPVAALVTIPTKALLGIVSIEGVLLAVVFSAVLLTLSLLSWQYALKQYASASS
ncbi:MAG TPA: ABC-2 family transporter protein [Patescibacteria group bacterium]|nr:ABC-2 family transporter protein [Patescibacteria group bacterium]